MLFLAQVSANCDGFDEAQEGGESQEHKADVVSVSAICHKNVLLDGPSDGLTVNMTQHSLIRPLGRGVNGV